MFNISRVLAALVLALLVGPMLMATAALADQGGTITGNVIDNTGVPIGGAQMLLEGPTAATTSTDPTGHFNFTAVSPGLYNISAVKGGYTSVTLTDVAVVTGATSNVTIVMVAQSLTSLRVLGRQIVRAQRGTFNTTPASVNVVNAQVFADQGLLQVQRALDQIPGIVIGHPGTSANNAAPGAITFPNIRGALSNETASLIDGHPVSVGTFGDYVTTFLNPYFFRDTEIVKGPGADAPEVNYAIGGTVNFVLRDPTANRVGDVRIGFDNQKGAFSNWATSGSFFENNRFGYVLDYGVQDLPGPNRPYTNFWTLPSGVTINGFYANGFTTNAIPNPAVQNNPFAGSATLVACCFDVRTTYKNKTELAKFRYKLSPATTLTTSYLGSQTWTDQNGNHMYTIGTLFAPCGLVGTSAAPCPSYSGSIPVGTTMTTIQNVFTPTGEWEVNNEPIFESELRTTLGNDTILGRWYAATIDRLQFNALNSNVNWPTTYTLFGKVPLCTNPLFPYPVKSGKCAAMAGGPGVVFATPTVFNGTSVPVSVLGAYFRQTEEDSLHGYSVEYDHPVHDNLYSLAWDSWTGNTVSTQILGNDPVQLLNNVNPALHNANIVSTSVTVPGGSNQRYSTLLARAIFQAAPKITAEFSNYLNFYNSTYSPNAALNPTNPSVWVFQNYVYTHYDPRLGLTWRPTTDLSWRFSTGSSIAPPYLALLNFSQNCVAVQPATSPFCPFSSSAGGEYTQNLSSGNLNPETAWGYDWGGDWRMPSGQDFISWDAYFTTLYNQFLKASYQNGTYNDGTHGTHPLIVTTNQNLGYSRYYGAELSYRHIAPHGFGWTMQGALMRGYPFNLPPCFYSSTPQAANCQFQFNTNLAILPYVNFETNGTSGSPDGFNAISNQSVPYAQAYDAVNWRGSFGQFYEFGGTYYGNNNSFNRTAFWVANATVREPIGDKYTTLQLSVDNAFGTLSTPYIIQNGGIAQPLANGLVGQTNGNSLGPAVWRLELHRTFGYSATGQ